MNTELACFKDRTHAGRLLAEALMKYSKGGDVIVLGLPRGGVPVAFEVARRLHAPLDVVVVRKLGAPGWEELAMGAIASGGVRILNNDVLHRARVTRQQLHAATMREMAELHRREMTYRGYGGAPNVQGKAVILVDDGIATGATIHSAVRALRPQDPAAIIVAAPTASRDACELMRPIVDELVTLMVPDDFRGVGQWYESFGQTSDEVVTRLLAEARHHTPSHAAE